MNKFGLLIIVLIPFLFFARNNPDSLYCRGIQKDWSMDQINAYKLWEATHFKKPSAGAVRQDAIRNGNKITTEIRNFGSISAPGNHITDIVWEGPGYGYEFVPFVGTEAPVPKGSHPDVQMKREANGNVVTDANDDTVWAAMRGWIGLSGLIVCCVDRCIPSTYQSPSTAEASSTRRNSSPMVSDIQHGASRSHYKGGESMASSTTYPVKYASLRRDCYIDVASSGRGKTSWAIPMKLPEGESPDHILIFDNRVVVVSERHLNFFDSAGAHLALLSIRPMSFAVVEDGRLYYQSETYYLCASDAMGRSLLNETYLPLASEPYLYVRLFWPGETDFLSVIQNAGRGRMPPAVAYYRNRYGDTFATWEKKQDGQLELSPLLLPNRRRLLLSFSQRVMVVDTNTGDTLSKLSLSVDEMHDWSADVNGSIYILGKEPPAVPSKRPRSVLLAVGPDGGKRWQWAGAAGKVRWVEGHPPVIGKDGTVYLLIETAVLAIRKGMLVWDYACTPRYATALADGTLLVTSGRQLIRLSSQGDELFSVGLEAHPLTPPVVDAAGDIYVATSDRLIKIH